ncbi:hypothetical protein NQ317_008202 [Molorchus minor]|uniref:Uncharacterized protein n=1 Tax=Molorchus minor TaxID=1323400 RepID=A0ABQ9JBG2_9CUCU|nr:hypothetical protein NQ317_008202 [Molorchus minor]
MVVAILRGLLQEEFPLNNLKKANVVGPWKVGAKRTSKRQIPMTWGSRFNPVRELEVHGETK